MKRTVRRAIARVAPEVTGGIRVLLYHAVDEPAADDVMSLRVPRDQFLEQMKTLTDARYEVVPLSAVAGLEPSDDRRVRVAITFDDGYLSQGWAAQVLREFGFPATFFVTPRFLDGVKSPQTYPETWGHLGWNDAVALIEAGFEIGAHSATHPDLRRCDRAGLDEEISGARTLLQERLGTDIVSFSYPFGRHDARVREAVQRAGYRLGCTSRYGLNRGAGARYAVQRTEITGTDDVTEFRWKLQGKYDWLGYWQDVRPT